jgi:hypothetical protein
MRGRTAAREAVAGLAGVLTVIAVSPLVAHKPITSKYTYNADVYPIFKTRCGDCHVSGGPAPMSLLNYKDAVPWAESIREELVAEKMPPSFVDPFGPAVKGRHAISPKELDTIITWATGGTPEGDVSKRPEPAAPSRDWPLGTPDVVVAMPADHVVPAEAREETIDVPLATSIGEARSVKAADLLPGDPSIVRDATIAVENGPVLALWVPGERAATAPDGAAFALPAGARLMLHIHYKKGWQDERAAKTDRSRVGLYFADRQATVRSIAAISVNQTTNGATSVVAVRPRLDRAYGSLDVHAILPDGTHVALLRLSRPRPEWPRRYWLEKPITLPAGSRIEMSTTPAPIDPDEPEKPPTGSLDAVVEFLALTQD